MSLASLLKLGLMSAIEQIEPSPLNPLILTALLASAALCFASTAHAQDHLHFLAGAAVGDLVCPSPPEPLSHTAPPADQAQPPPAEALGELARAVVREQPMVDPATLAGFDPRGAGERRPLRIAVWGDSHVAAGAFMPTLIDRLQARGLTVATRYLPPSMGRANVRLRGLRGFCVGPGWSTELAYAARERLQVGPALINRVAAGGLGSYLWLDLRSPDRQAHLRTVRIVYRAPEGGILDIAVNDGPERQAVLEPGSGSRTLDLETDGEVATVRLRVSRGRIVLHGFVLEPSAPPQVGFDVFGTPSSTARGWANLDPAYLAGALHGETYDAVMLEYGTNDGSDPRFEPDRYAAGLQTALANLRQVFPHAACVLVGPPDRGVLWRPGDTPNVLTWSRHMQAIAAIQARVGAGFGCASWDWQALMGGPGGGYGWLRHGPPLIGRDLTHMTSAGYRLTGEALARSLGF